jgi:hypothetical protein
LANLRPGEARFAFVAGFANGVDLAGPIEIGVGPGIEYRAVDDAENRNCRANSQRQRKNRSQGEARSPRHLPKRKAQVL